MIIDLDQSVELPPLSSTVCIAGAGAAGIALAIELAGRGVGVTLLESGGLHPEPATQNLYQSDVAGLRHRGVHCGRFRVLGGTTTQWGGQILPLDSHDFEHRRWVPRSGWPFSKSVLKPFYRRALELEGLAGAWLDDTDVWKSIGVPAPDFGDSLIPFFSRWCPEPDFGRLFRDPLRENANITVLLHANVCEILLDGSRQAIAGLRCRTLEGREAVVTADAYVICLGGIESARLLLQPLADDARAPWNESGMTGRFFQDHIDASLIQVRPRSPKRLHRWFDNFYHRGFKYHPKLKLSASEQQRRNCLSIGATFEFRSRKAERVANLREGAQKFRRGLLNTGEALRLARHVPDAGLLLRQAARFKLRGRAYNPDDAGIFLRVHCEQAPDPDSRIILTSARDATGMRRIRLCWRVGELEIATMRHFSEVVRQAFARSGFADVTAIPALEEGGAALFERFDDSNHHMGATRMANSCDGGVVNPDLRLFGVRNGYVCSSSVFPTGGFSNPTHTLIALAVRLAAHLAEQYKGKAVLAAEPA
ncbi:MAG TPA: GMC family oxidoreductase [Bryobacteraceae bacterium]|jgi:choline dehydrogenase-like flavoprotein|nr:GMC family oxidoreductase [Bryobacteraceae bacterium]